MKIMNTFCRGGVLLSVLCFLSISGSVSAKIDWTGWKTNIEKSTVDFSELQSGGVGKNGIASIDDPKFVSADKAALWLKDKVPVISVVIKGHAKAYPLEILTWHEIVNDTLGGTSIAVTFCPLCYTAIAFDRNVDGQELTLGVSGFLRNSDMVMYDRQGENLWQQFTGEAIVGDMVGKTLARVNAQIISFEQFKKAYPKGIIMSRETGFDRNYGRNPYVGYDDINSTPFLYKGGYDKRLKPMERVIAVGIGNEYRAYPHFLTRKKQVVNDVVGGKEIVVFHGAGAVSAVDNRSISNSRQIGSTGVYYRKVDDRMLTFIRKGKEFVDEQTQSSWDITGRAVKGKLSGKQLKAVNHHDTFAFAWLAFKPKTEIYRANDAGVEKPVENNKKN